MTSLYIAGVPAAEGRIGDPKVDAALGTDLMRNILEMGENWINETNTGMAFEPLVRAANALLEQSDSGASKLLHAKVLNNLGVLYFAVGDLQQASNALCNSEMVARGLIPQDNEVRAGALHNLGVLYASNGQTQEASQYFDESRALGLRVD